MNIHLSDFKCIIIFIYINSVIDGKDIVYLNNGSNKKCEYEIKYTMTNYKIAKRCRKDANIIKFELDPKTSNYALLKQINKANGGSL